MLDGNNWIVAIIQSTSFSASYGDQVNELYIGEGIYNLTLIDVSFKDLQPFSGTKATAIYKVGSTLLNMYRVSLNCLYEN